MFAAVFLQVLLQSLALLVSDAWHYGHNAPAAAELLHGSWELTSQTHETSFKSVFNEVCEWIPLWISTYMLTHKLRSMSKLSWGEGWRLYSNNVDFRGKWTDICVHGLVGFLMGKTVEAISLLFRLMYLVALFTPTLFVGAFIDQTDGPLRRFWLHLLLRSLESAGKFLMSWVFVRPFSSVERLGYVSN